MHINYAYFQVLGQQSEWRWCHFRLTIHPLEGCDGYLPILSIDILEGRCHQTCTIVDIKDPIAQIGFKTNEERKGNVFESWDCMITDVLTCIVNNWGVHIDGRGT
jgi:hypothetical protein